MRLPILSRINLPLQVQDLVEHLKSLMWQDAIIDPESGGLTGYLQVEVKDGRHAVLFLHAGEPFVAGSLEQGRFIPRSLDDFKAFFPHAISAEFCVTDPALFLCVAALFSKKPSVVLQAPQIQMSTVQQTLASAQGESCLVVHGGDAISLVYCQAGTPISLYAAAGEEMPAGGSVPEQVVAYAAQTGARAYFIPDVTLSVPAGAPSLMSYFGLANQSLELDVEENPALVVRLGDRRLFQYPLSRGKVVIGRGLDADLILDNLSVSRAHATVERVGGKVEIYDNGSANGMLYNGQAASSAVLKPGDEVVIGKYTLEYTTRAAATSVSTAPQAPSASALQGTVMVGDHSGIAELEYAGMKHPLTAMFFVVGSGERTALQLDDPNVAASHMEIQRRPDGYYVKALAQGAPVAINGTPVSEAQLRHGDVISLGEHQMTFLQG